MDEQILYGQTYCTYTEGEHSQRQLPARPAVANWGNGRDGSWSTGWRYATPWHWFSAKGGGAHSRQRHFCATQWTTLFPTKVSTHGRGSRPPPDTSASEPRPFRPACRFLPVDLYVRSTTVPATAVVH